jgi:hypothetical protein
MKSLKINVRPMFKLKRLIVKYKKRIKFKNEEKIVSRMTKQQLSVFNTVKDVVSKNRSSIMFDPMSRETLVVLPDMLITLKHDMVYIDNTSGFLSVKYDIRAHQLLTNFINSEVHRERRKLKYEVKQRINEFIKKISEESEKK